VGLRAPDHHSHRDRDATDETCPESSRFRALECPMTNSNLDDVISLAREESFLATISTIRSDGAIQSTLVNAGVMADPASGEQVVATVLIGSTAKLRILRTRPNLTLS